MLNFEEVVPALERLARRLPGRGQVRSWEVGRKNELRGHAYFIDYGSYRIVFVITGLGSKALGYTRGVFAHPSAEYETFSGSGLSLRMDLSWDHCLYGLEDQLRDFRSPRKGPAWPSREIHPAPLPDEHYPVVAAALRQRFAAWGLSLMHLSGLVEPASAPFDGPTYREWCPQLHPGLESACPQEQFALDLARVKLPWPVVSEGVQLDALDFYQSFPDAHGKLYLGPLTFSADGSQCVLTMRHSLAVKNLGPHSFAPVLPLSLSAEPGEFLEFVLLEKHGQEWTLAAHLPHDVSTPPVLLESREKARLQAELGDWGEVISVQVGSETAQEARVMTPLGERRVLCAQAFGGWAGDWQASQVFPEPTVWIFARTITGDLIRQAFPG